MHIWINEQPHNISEDARLFEMRDRFKPQADVVILNGFPVTSDRPLSNGDRIVLIRRGEIPTSEELEALLVARHTPGVHARLKQATVGIAGVGGLGSPIAIALTRSGVGRLLLVDYDVVEPSNLNRQMYFVDQIGQPKVEALAATLARINPGVKVSTRMVRLTRDNVAEIFDGVDVMVEAFDDPQAKAMLTETFLSRFPDTPLVAASGVAGAGPANAIVTRRAIGNLYLVGDGETAAAPGTGLMAPRVGVAAHHQANAVLQLLLGESPA
ncbi:thiamin biosynthesis thiocarboxylate synthase [Syntrophotalea carbinolica DSM 2380]|uniref:Thiamin biosynthesis thiocarboxylate synthase n=1 Tax=Syntrophotalea carbinolica (strain DSM 2380 / NBRC 103641 / GraBd1) TaxID=338963 RepID=Q3A6Y7_SYNC1|nr:sulfur carrier protein ThiS adenylyltransferase ThiF [Syntrophotalea carbinolica]ABA87870.1 thiamin biosynthesis thiocarboxylate synthase [Syntrophotalea carbinolica DSM 2380]